MRRTAIAKATVIAVMEKVHEDLRLVYLKELDKKTTATSKNQYSRRVSGHGEVRIHLIRILFA